MKGGSMFQNVVRYIHTKIQYHGKENLNLQLNLVAIAARKAFSADVSISTNFPPKI